MFKLDPRIEADTLLVADLELSRVLLMNDSQYPWLVQVPVRENITEIIELSQTEQQQLWCESALISQLLKDTFNPDKLNVAALGNMVPQLHIHHIARFTTDNAWPAPVWGAHPAKPYLPEDAEKLIAQLNQLF